MNLLDRIRKELRKRWKNERGVTFIELLGVLVILVQLYLIYAHSFGNGTVKAKLSAVQQTYRQYQAEIQSAMTENTGFPSTNGINIDYTQLNKYLDKSLQIPYPSTIGTGITHPTANPLQITNLKDPWGHFYDLQALYLPIGKGENVVLVRSAGTDGQMYTTNDIFEYDYQNGLTSKDYDDVLYVADYINGTEKDCTKGLSKDLGSVKLITNDAPWDLSQYQQPSWNARVDNIPKYKYEYTLLFQAPSNAPYNGQLYRGYAYSNIPLSFIGSGGVLKDVNSNPFQFTEWWSPVTSPLTMVAEPLGITSENGSGVFLKGMTLLWWYEIDGATAPTIVGCN